MDKKETDNMDTLSLGVGFIISHLLFDTFDKEKRNVLILFPPEDEMEYFMDRYSTDLYEGNEWWNDLVNICKNEKYVIAPAGEILSAADKKFYQLPSSQICILYPITYSENQEDIEAINKKMAVISEYCGNENRIFIFTFSSDEVIIDENGELKGIIRYRTDDEIFQDHEEFGM